MEFNSYEHQHIRYNPLLDEWVLVSPHRALRPWSGQTETPASDTIPDHDPTNPLCPGVTRASGITTPDYKGTYVFTNDFPALLEHGPSPPAILTDENQLFRSAPATGTCRVICYHPNSNMYLNAMSTDEIVAVIECWIEQIRELGAMYVWVQIFENRGAMMGCSNPHPHCQVWASSFMPNEARRKDDAQRAYYNKNGSPLLYEYMRRELESGERTIHSNKDWLVVVPYWAVWPYETMVLPKREGVKRFTDIRDGEKLSLAHTLKVIVAKYDNLFKCSFPYSMGWHGAPTGDRYSDDESVAHWTFHGVYLPPLLRSATVKKFMVGYELLAQAQRDLTPETAANTLRKQPEKHYKTKPTPILPLN